MQQDTAQTPAPQLFTVEEAARRLTLSPRMVRMLISAGTLPAIRMGKRRVAISSDDLATYVAAQRRA